MNQESKEEKMEVQQCWPRMIREICTDSVEPIKESIWQSFYVSIQQEDAYRIYTYH